jgi:3-isopropylmalate dehydrogenase
MGAILSAALMLDTLGLREEASAIEAAVAQAVAARQGTKDIGGTLGTKEPGDFNCGAIARPRHAS